MKHDKQLKLKVESLRNTGYSQGIENVKSR